MQRKPPGVRKRKAIGALWRRRSRRAVRQNMLRADEMWRLKSARVSQERSFAGAAGAGIAEPRSTTAVMAQAARVRMDRPYTVAMARCVKCRAMQFTAPAEHYDRFMGRYVPRLAVALAAAAGVEAGMRALDVGCGPGGLTRELVSRLGADHVAAIDPAEQFAEACRARNPGADVRVGGAEELPFDDATFDVALSSLVIGFMRDADPE